MRARLLEMTGPDLERDDAEFFVEILRSFADRSHGRLDELVAAVARGDVETAGQLAHGLRGSAGNLGGDAFAQLLEAVEAGCRAGRLPPADDFGALAEELVPLQAALRLVAAELEAGPASSS